MLTAFAIGFVCFFIRKFFVKTKDLQSANSVFVDDNSKLNEGKELTESEFNDYVNSKSTMAVDKYGHKFWKNKKGQYHREDGPACEYVHGIKQWFVEGKELTEQQFNIHNISRTKYRQRIFLNSIIFRFKRSLQRNLIQIGCMFILIVIGSVRL